MRTLHRIVAVAAAVVAAACSPDGSARDLLSPTHPHFTVTTGSISCPDTISVGQTSSCSVEFRDENNQLVSTTVTWGTTTSSLISVTSVGAAAANITGLAVGNANVNATAGGLTVNDAVYVKPGLSVSIVGPGQVQKFDTCSWYASVSGGTSPYSYTWTATSASGSLSGNSWTGYLIGGSSTFTVTVTDANGVQKQVQRQIVAFFSAPLC